MCNDYLDEIYPENQLNPKDPYVKARQRILLERWGKVLQNSRNIFVRYPKIDKANKITLRNIFVDPGCFCLCFFVVFLLFFFVFFLFCFLNNGDQQNLTVFFNFF